MERIEAIHHRPAEPIASAPPSFFQRLVSLFTALDFIPFLFAFRLHSGAQQHRRLFPEEKGSDKACVRHLFRTKQQGNVYLMNTAEK